jgi:hypothetical protein
MKWKAFSIRPDDIAFEMQRACPGVECPTPNLRILPFGIGYTANHSILLDDVEQDLGRLPPSSSDQIGILTAMPGELDPDLAKLATAAAPYDIEPRIVFAPPHTDNTRAPQ